MKERYRQQKEEAMKHKSANVQVIQEMHKNAVTRKRELLVNSFRTKVSGMPGTELWKTSKRKL